ncbi:MAG: hypothetical protein JW715_06305 [Sedimentisphaerales bacterium]|nr:hypothetical protein [Sedimentisphaerales bacterium]
MVLNADNRIETLAARVRKVRRWLAAIAILKVAAVCLLFVCGYIGAYMWLDHLFNFSGLSRIIALTLLIIAAAFILYKLSRLLIVQISYTNAANYIENKNSFDQQLVAAMEYYEKKTDYPYSEALAEYLVAKVSDDSDEFKFDSTIEKWHCYILAAAVLLGFCVIGLYIQRNLAYLKTYVTRLTMPLSSVEPVPTTMLESTTGDFVAEPESILEFKAEIQGRVPENGMFVLEPLSNDSNEIQPREEIPITAVIGENGNPTLETSNFFEETGKFRYRFEAGQTSSEWHNIEIREAPKIESITAEVSLPAKLENNKMLKNYTEQIKDNKLELVENSTVTLHIRTTENISEAAITGLDSLSSSKQLDGTNTFTYSFTAEKDGSVGFRITDEKGLTNKNIPDLEIKLKTDEPPEFKLISPESDYLATNVASIPIEFDVTDDFGLNSIQICLELPDRQPTVIDIPVETGEKKHKAAYVLELERHDLKVGDSILFYARATDIATGIIPENNRSSSDTYFIEIRPYQQFWHLMPGGGESQSPGGTNESLMTVLEYTRAIVKKTWTIADKQIQTEEDNSRLDYISDDLTYCSELLKIIRDDPENNFTEAHKAVLNQVLSQYEQALDNLKRHDAPSALLSEKNAYRILRKFILELDMQYNPPSSGKSIPQEKPDKVTLQESPELTGMEKERIEEQMQKMQNNIEQLKKEQKQLKTDFENFLEQKKQAQIKSQSESEKKTPDKENEEQKNQQDSEGGQNQDNKQKSQSETSSQSSGNSSGESQDSNKSQSSSSGQSSSQNDNQAKQNSLSKSDNSRKENNTQKEQSSTESDKNDDKQSDSQKDQSDSDEKNSDDNEGSAGNQQSQTNQADSASKSGSPSENSGNNQADGKNQSYAQSGKSTMTNENTQAAETSQDSVSQVRDTLNEDARLKMLQAKQKALQEKVSQLKQDLEKIPQSTDSTAAKATNQAQEHLDKAIEKMERFQNKMNDMRYDSQSDSRKATEAVELMDSAERDLDSAENSLEPATMLSDEQQLAKKAQEMAEQLSEDAQALEESLTAVEREEMLARLKAAEKLLESMSRSHWATIQKGGGQTGGGSVLTKDTSKAADTAREISRQFWSIALDAQKRLEQPIEEKSSDVRFYELENEFFENAAKYNQKPETK